ncbi:MAG: hypothetical protein IEMM0002_0640 [bacterium]|nr:MAG: hypothetical protein IEMM0002_0640 [bacterium]
MVDSIRYQYKIALVCLTLFTAPHICVNAARAVEVGGKLPFRVGEKLTYNVTWLMFDAGRMVLSIPEMVSDSGQNLMHLKLHTATANTLAQICRMDDYFHSYWDVDSRASKKLVVKIRESFTTTDKVVEFDHHGAVAVVTENGKEPEEKELVPFAQDFLSAGYYTRLLPLEPSTQKKFSVFEDNQNYDAVVKVIKKEKIRIMGGEIDTVMIIPKIKLEGAFQSRGTIYMWLTDDEYKVPVKIKANIFVGTVTLLLTEAEGVNLNIKYAGKR